MLEFFIQEKQFGCVIWIIVKNEKGYFLFLMVGCWGIKGDVLFFYVMNGDFVVYIK